MGQNSATGHLGTGMAALVLVGGGLGVLGWMLDAPVWAGWLWGLWCLLWLIGMLGLSDGPSRGFIAASLRRARPGRLNATLTKRNLGAVWPRLCEAPPDRPGTAALIACCLTPRMADRALLASTVAPLMLAGLIWAVSGAPIALGGTVLLPEAGAWPLRALALAGGAALLLSLPGLATGAAGGWRVVSGGALGICALAVPGLALLGALPAALALGAAGAVVLGASGLSVLGGALVLGAALLGPVPLVLALAGLGGAVLLTRQGRPATGLFGLYLYGVFVLPLLPVLAAPGAAWAEHGALFAALLLLPLAGALADGAGWVLSLALLRRSLEGNRPAGWIASALAAAGAMALLKGLALVALAVAVARLSPPGGFLAPGPALAALAEAPGTRLWLIAVLLLPMVPMLLHLAMVLAGVHGLWPQGLRDRVATLVETSPQGRARALAGGLGLAGLWALPLLLLGAGLWGLGAALFPALTAAAEGYGAALSALATLAAR